MTIEELITREVNNAEIRICNHPRGSEERIYSRGIRDMGNYILSTLPTLDLDVTLKEVKEWCSGKCPYCKFWENCPFVFGVRPCEWNTDEIEGQVKEARRK